MKVVFCQIALIASQVIGCNSAISFEGTKSSNPEKELTGAASKSQEPEKANTFQSADAKRPLDSGSPENHKEEGEAIAKLEPSKINSDIDGETVSKDFENCGKTEQGTIKLTLPTNIQNCVDKGVFYHFDKQACAENTPITKDFECNIENITQKLEELGISESKINRLKEEIKTGANFFGCSLKNAENTLIVQSWSVKDSNEGASCSIQGKSFLTGCYRFVGNQMEKNPTSPEEIREFVNECLAESS